MLVATGLLLFFIFLFARECKKDQKRHIEQECRANEHVMREIERFMKEKGLK